MKNMIFCFGIAVLLFSCQKQKKSEVLENNAFDRYKNDFVTRMWTVFPDYAAATGYHKYDAILTINDSLTRKKQLDFVQANLDSLEKYDLKILNPANSTDYRMIENQLKSTVFSFTEEQSYTWNPSEYNVCGAFAEILNGNYDALSIRLKNFDLKMNGIEAYYNAAKHNIQNPTLEHTQLAIEQNLGGISVFEKDFVEAVNKANLTDKQKENMIAKANKSVAVIRDFASWLKNLNNKTPRSFRLGKVLYDKKFAFDIQSAYTVDEMFKNATDHKKELHDKMFVLSNKLWSKYLGTAAKPNDSLQLIRQVIDKISLNHTTPELFQSEIEKQIPVLVDYIKKKDLIYIDPSKPLVVRKEPDYMAGVAGASISAPGPYDKNGKTY